VVDPDAVPDQPVEGGSEAAGEPEAAQLLGDGVATVMLVSAWARSSAAAWVKWTTYTGA
jgi:hypothetical protein